MPRLRARPNTQRTISGGAALAWTRWLLLALFPLGALTSPLRDDMHFLLWNGVALLSLALLLTRLRDLEALWAWMTLGVFLQGYYYKTYRTAVGLGSPDFIQRSGDEYQWLRPEVLVEGLGWTTLAFVIFCGTAWILLGLRLRAGPSRLLLSPERQARVIRRATALATVTLAAGLLACVAQVYLGFGTMGAIESKPGFGLATLIVRFRMEVGPALLLLALWVLEECRSSRSVLVVAGFLLLAAADTLIRTSRGSFIFYMIPVVLLWALSKRLDSWRLSAGLAALVLTTALVPFISAMRTDRLSKSTGLFDSAQSAFDDTKGTLFDRSGDSAEHVAGRVSGVEGVWSSMRFPPVPPSTAIDLLLADEVSTYYTREVCGVSVEGDFRAPGLVGTTMILGGWPAVVSLTVGFTGFLWAAWAALGRATWVAVLRAYAANRILFVTSENPFGYKWVVGVIVTSLVLAVMWRLLFEPLISAAPTAHPTDERGVGLARLGLP